LASWVSAAQFGAIKPSSKSISQAKYRGGQDVASPDFVELANVEILSIEKA